ncbi:MAG: hypothetical protein ACP6KW_11635 [Candidatus Thorarchaeota archaeon]
MQQSQTLDEMHVETSTLVRLSPRQLDATLGTVILPQQVSLIHGPERAPLTLVAHAIAAGGVLAGGRSVFLDSGGNYRPNLIRALLGTEATESVGRMVVAPVFGLPDVPTALEGIHGMGNVRVVVLDSLTGALNLSGDSGSKKRQRALFRVLELIRELVLTEAIHFVMTDYSSRDWKTGQVRIIGGNVLAHSIDTSVYCSAIRTIEDGILVSVERSPVIPLPDSVAIKIGFRGARSLKGR